jgi:hypothetical protein
MYITTKRAITLAMEAFRITWLAKIRVGLLANVKMGSIVDISS